MSKADLDAGDVGGLAEAEARGTAGQRGQDTEPAGVVAQDRAEVQVAQDRETAQTPGYRCP